MDLESDPKNYRDIGMSNKPIPQAVTNAVYRAFPNEEAGKIIASMRYSPLMRGWVFDIGHRFIVVDEDGRFLNR